jgi:putative spermidine/putrescine transport system permease protein
MPRTSNITSYLQVAPLALVFVGFLVFPILAIIVVSFWDYTEYSIVPGFVLTNYRDVLFSGVTYTTYVNTLKFAALTWLLTLTIGFTVAYFLAFHVRTFLWQMVLFLVCTVPFLTSNIIRMISWVPFLGRHGIFNATLRAFGLCSVR